MLHKGKVDDNGGMFLELGVNRLARDLFLLTAVYALFLVMCVQLTAGLAAAEGAWAREGRVTESKNVAENASTLSVHLRKDGKLVVGGQFAENPQQAEAIVSALLKKQPELAQATVIFNAYGATPSVETSDMVQALIGAGLSPASLHMRFTDE